MKRWMLAALLFGCLPEDTRPPPALVNVSFRGGESTINGFTTLDGWRIQFDRVLVSIGNAGVGGDACTEYAGSGYFRILDGKSSTPEKVGLVYGLGTCSFELRARNPESDALLGSGVTEDDKTAMRTPGSDAHEQNAGITFWIRGQAERAGVRKSFEWKYRRRRVGYSECEIDGFDTFTLSGDEEKFVEVRVHAEVLFQDHPEADKARLRFDPFANADANGDGIVTLEELDAVKIGASGIDLSTVFGAENVKTLGDYLYDATFPQLMRVGEKGICTLRNRPIPPEQM